MVGRRHKLGSRTYKPFYLRQNPKQQDAVTKMLKYYPSFVPHMLEDLLSIEGFSEAEVGFGSSVPLEVIREMTTGNFSRLNQETSLALLGLYARVFCNWWAFREE